MYNLNKIKNKIILNYIFYVPIGIYQYGSVLIDMNDMDWYGLIQITKRNKKIIILFNYRNKIYRYDRYRNKMYRSIPKPN